MNSGCPGSSWPVGVPAEGFGAHEGARLEESGRELDKISEELVEVDGVIEVELNMRERKRSPQKAGGTRGEGGRGWSVPSGRRRIRV